MKPLKRKFPCEVYPDTATNAFGTVHLAALVIALVASGPLVSYEVDPSLAGADAGLSALLLLYFPFIRYGFLGFFFCLNIVLNFVRTAEFHFGRDIPRRQIRPFGPLWLLATVTVVLGLPSDPWERAAAVYGLIALRFSWVCAWYRIGFKRMWDAVSSALFTFAAYPDTRYTAPAGTSAVWLARSPIPLRRAYLVLLLLPFYLAFVTSLAYAAANCDTTPGRLLGELLLFLPAPHLCLAAAAAGPVLRMRKAAVDLDAGASNDWERASGIARDSDVMRDGWTDHFFLGWVLPTREQAPHPLHSVNQWDLPCRTPALVEASALEGHVHLEGPTGFGKTTIGQAGLAIQVIRGRSVPALDADGSPLLGLDGEPYVVQSDPEPVVTFDMKGDLSLFQLHRETCIRHGRPFRFFTLEMGKATSYFNPLTDLRGPRRPVIEVVEVILNSLDLWHGQFFYGGGYYAEQSRNLLLKAVKSAKTPPRSWEDLYGLLLETVEPRLHRDVFELLGRVFALTQYPVIGPAPDGVDEINMADVVANGECVYFWLPAMGSSMSGISVAKLALFSLVNAAQSYNNSGRRLKRTWLFIDEAQVVVGQNMERLFQQASGARINLVLSNQSRASLDTRDAPNLSSTIWDNTRIKLAFGLVDTRERKQWIDVSGETSSYIADHGRSLQTDVRTSEKKTTEQTTLRQVIHPRLNQNAINAVTNTPGSALLYMTRDAGLCRFNNVPCQVWCPFPMTREAYERRSRTPWPEMEEVQQDTSDSARRRRGGLVVVNRTSPEETEAQARSDYAELETLFDDAARRSGRQRR